MVLLTFQLFHKRLVTGLETDTICLNCAAVHVKHLDLLAIS